jgi:hypothetical protein
MRLALALFSAGLLLAFRAPALQEGPPKAPWTPDRDTLLLVHFDRPEELQPGAGSRVTLAKDVSIAPDGAFGSCLKFDRERGYIRLDGADGKLSPAISALTLEAWVRLKDVRGYQFIIAQTNLRGYQLGIHDGRLFCFLTTHDERWTGGEADNASAKVPAGRWCHVAMTYDGEMVRLFLDGREILGKTVDGGPLVEERSDVIVGMRRDLAEHEEWKTREFFKGEIDEVRISSAVRYPGQSKPERPAARAETRVYGVDASKGDDTADGSLKAPWKTLTKAAASARAGDLVLIMPGTYREGLAPAHGGTPEQPVSFVARRPGTVVLEGGSVRCSDGINYVVLKGLTIRETKGPGITARRGWRIEDCLLQKCGEGISVSGSHWAIVRSVIEDSGGNSLSGGWGLHQVVEGCILRRGNRRGENPADTTGACKLLDCEDIRVQDVVSYDHTGQGWWFDWNSRNYVVDGCTVFGCHGLRQGWEGAGIFSEVNPGPGRITNNLVYSCTGTGIGVAESSGVTVSGNVVVDCGNGVEFRDMARPPGLHDLEIARNTFKSMRGPCITTSIGEWKQPLPPGYKIRIDANAYDMPADKTRLLWQKTKCKTLDDARSRLGVEAAGTEGPAAFDRPLIPTVVDPRSQVEPFQGLGILEQLGAAGGPVSLMVHGRGDVQVDPSGGRYVEVYDLARRTTVRVDLATETIERAVCAAIPRWASLIPATVRGELTSADPYALRLRASGAEPPKEVAPAAPRPEPAPSAGDLPGIARAAEGKKAGDVVWLPAHARNVESAGLVKILDLQGGTATLRVGPALLPKINAIKTYPLTTPTWVKVRLSAVTGDSVEGEALDTRD